VCTGMYTIMERRRGCPDLAHPVCVWATFLPNLNSESASLAGGGGGEYAVVCEYSY
jgi:hypothetical protein